MHPTWIANSLLNPPQQRVVVIPRPRLLDRLVSPDAPLLSVVQAPAGFGKTTFLAQVYAEARSRGLAAAWVTLESGDRDLHWLYACLLVALRRQGIALPGYESTGDDELLSWPEPTLAGLLNAALEGCASPLMLLVDDAHLLAPEALSDGITTLAQSVPAGARLVLAARSRVDRHFWRLAARGELQVTDERDLRFNEEESRLLLGTHEDTELLERLMTAAEGWPVALQLARIWFNDRDEGPGQIERLTRTSGDLAALVCEQLMVSFTEEHRLLLVRCAGLERMRAELLDELFGGSGGAAFLEELATRTPMVVPLEGDTGWYRFHTLFAEFLRGRFEALRKEETASLHRRAAEWFQAGGLLQEAFRQADRSGDHGLMADVAERAGGWRLAIGGGRPALAWLYRLPVADAKSHPRVRLGQIYSMAQDGLVREARAAMEDLREATRGFTRGRHARWDPSLAIECETLDVILRIYEDRPIQPASLFALERQIGGQAGLDRRLASLSANLVCFGHYDVGDFESCLRHARLGLERNRAAGSSYAEAYLLLYMGMACFGLCRQDECRGYYSQALSRAREVCGPQSNLSALASVLLARVEIESGQALRARELLRNTFAAVLERDGWFDVFAAGFETAFWLGLIEGGEAEALAALEPAFQQAKTRGIGRLALFARLLRGELHLLTGKLCAAREQLAEVANSGVLPDMASPAPRDLRLVAMFFELQARAQLTEGATQDSAAAAATLQRNLAPSGLAREGVRAQLLSAAISLSGESERPGRAAIELALRAAARADMVLSVARHGSRLASALVPFATGAVQTAFLARALRLAQQIESALGRSSGPAQSDPLSPRELQILRELVNGLSNKEIARRFEIAESTVKTHKERLYEKLGASSRSGAIEAARSRGLVD